MASRASADVDVAVVGGGIFGVCVADHLLDQGAGRVLIVERDTPAAATSRAGGGFVSLWAAAYNGTFGPTDLVLEEYGLRYYRDVARAQPSVDLRANGNLFVALTESGYRNKVEAILEHPLAPEGTIALDAAEVARITGDVLTAEAVYGGAYHPTGIQLSAGRATGQIVDRFVERGGQLRSHTACNGLLTSGSSVIGVRTDAGDIHARAVVVAGGAWSNSVLTDVDYRAPLARWVATRAISLPSGVPSVMPTVVVPELSSMWLREHRGGLTWGSADGYAPLADIGGSVDELAQPRREELVERLAAGTGSALSTLVPHHGTAIDWWLQGMPCSTPDGRFLAGPVPGVNGLYLLAGDNESGVTHGPGLGRMVADLVLNQTCEWVDHAAYRLDRFESGDYLTERSVLSAQGSAQPLPIGQGES